MNDPARHSCAARLLEGTPPGTRVAYVTAEGQQVVVLGQPAADDATHNCDAMGCGQDHVLQRLQVAPPAVARPSVGQCHHCGYIGTLGEQCPAPHPTLPGDMLMPRRPMTEREFLMLQKVLVQAGPSFDGFDLINFPAFARDLAKRAPEDGHPEAVDTLLAFAHLAEAAQVFKDQVEALRGVQLRLRAQLPQPPAPSGLVVVRG